MTTCSDFPSVAMLWIKEVEMVDSLDELKSCRSVCGKDFPNFEMLDAKIASALNKIIQDSPVQEEGQPRGAESPKGGSTRKTDRLHDLLMIQCWFMLIYSLLFLHDDNTQEFGSRWDEVLLSMSKNFLSDDSLASLHKLRICESAQLKTILEL